MNNFHMRNSLEIGKVEVTNGREFLLYCFNEAAAELEKLTQTDIDKIAKIILAHTDRPDRFGLQAKA